MNAKLFVQQNNYWSFASSSKISDALSRSDVKRCSCNASLVGWFWSLKPYLISYLVLWPQNWINTTTTTLYVVMPICTTLHSCKWWLESCTGWHSFDSVGSVIWIPAGIWHTVAHYCHFVPFLLIVVTLQQLTYSVRLQWSEIIF